MGKRTLWYEVSAADHGVPEKQKRRITVTAPSDAALLIGHSDEQDGAVVASRDGLRRSKHFWKPYKSRTL